MSTTHKPKPQRWFRVECECGWKGSMWRADSAGMSSAWSDYREHREQEMKQE